MIGVYSKLTMAESSKARSTESNSRVKQWGYVLMGLLVLVVHSFYGLDIEKNFRESTKTMATHLARHTDSIPTGTCHHVSALYQSNMTGISEAVDAADKYHSLGGSLKAVQEYLDRQIAPTLDRLDITYQPKRMTTPDKNNNNNNNNQNDLVVLPVDEYLRQYFDTHDVPRGGYGQPLPLTYQSKEHKDTNNNAVLQKSLHKDRVQHRWMDVMEPWSYGRFQVAVGPQLPSCPHMAKFSEGTYEAKSFCLTMTTRPIENDSNGEVKNQQHGSTKDECHVFSIGSNDQWGFEEELLQKLPACHVHTFDCTLKDNTPRKKPNDARVHFYPHCVSSSATERGGKSYQTYSGLVAATGIQHPPKVLKMDIEGFEFDVLSNMLQSPSSLWPEQIMMEVHFASRMIDLTWLLRTRQTAEMAMFFDLLYNKGGYMPAHIKYINGCPTCMEILLVRVHCN